MTTPIPVHRCADAECPHFGKPTNRGCLCHKTSEQMLVEQRDGLLDLLRRWAALDGGEWHIERHASEKAALLAETRAAIKRATGERHG